MVLPDSESRDEEEKGRGGGRYEFFFLLAKQGESRENRAVAPEGEMLLSARGGATSRTDTF